MAHKFSEKAASNSDISVNSVFYGDWSAGIWTKTTEVIG